jgi:hypothetical protein
MAAGLALVRLVWGLCGENLDVWPGEGLEESGAVAGGAHGLARGLPVIEPGADIAFEPHQPVVQGRSFSGLRTAQMCLIRSPATSNANTVTVTPSC